MDWLLAGDHSIVWQTQRDLVDQPESVWNETRARVAVEGWGQRLLDLQDQDGKWGGGLYDPKWTSTTYTLLTLRLLGLDPGSTPAIAGVRRLLDDAVWVDGGVAYHRGGDIAEKCINGMVLSLATYFDVDDSRIDGVAEYLAAGTVDDGGWNCQDRNGHTSHSSFHTTISVLEGLDLWRRRRGSSAANAVIESGVEMFLAHGMFRSHRTGEVISDAWTRFSFPPRWHYDVLRGLDFLRETGASPDPRVEEALALVVARGGTNQRWPIGPRHPGRDFFRMEEGRNPSRWNTLRALRVLRWANGGEGAHASDP